MSVEGQHILTANEFRHELERYCEKATERILLISAYITAPAIKWIGSIVPKTIPVELVARWSYNDLCGGSSDFESYWRAKEFGYGFFVDPKLHTKAYIFDRSKVFIGSANLTSRGLWLNGRGNQEHVTLLSPDVISILMLEKLKNQAAELNDEIVLEMEATAKKSQSGSGVWPLEIRNKLEKPTEGLWVTDLLFSEPVVILGEATCHESTIEHDLKVLGLGPREISEDALRAAFLETKLCTWLFERLRDEGEMRFGRVTAALHDVLLDNPSPYRREVKEFVGIIFKWVEYLEQDQIEIQQHRHTASIHWKN